MNKMNVMTTIKETVEIKAGEVNLNVPYTSEGMEVVRAMVTLLEAGLPPMEEEQIKSEGDVSPKSEGAPEKRKKPSEDKATSPFSPPVSSSKQRIKFKNWTPIATTTSGTLYKEVIDRFLVEYKDGIEPIIENLFQIIREMYGQELKHASVATYVSQYKRYIRENQLAENPLAKTPSEGREEYKEGVTCLREIPIDDVVKIWNLLPSEFTYKQVKALIPAGTMQSGARIDATNYVIREFKENPAFECKETSSGEFEKILGERGNGEE